MSFWRGFARALEESRAREFETKSREEQRAYQDSVRSEEQGFQLDLFNRRIAAQMASEDRAATREQDRFNRDRETSLEDRDTLWAREDEQAAAALDRRDTERAEDRAWDLEDYDRVSSDRQTAVENQRAWDLEDRDDDRNFQLQMALISEATKRSDKTTATEAQSADVAWVAGRIGDADGGAIMDAITVNPSLASQIRETFTEAERKRAEGGERVESVIGEDFVSSIKLYGDISAPTPTIPSVEDILSMNLANDMGTYQSVMSAINAPTPPPLLGVDVDPMVNYQHDSSEAQKQDVLFTAEVVRLAEVVRAELQAEGDIAGAAELQKLLDSSGEAYSLNRLKALFGPDAANTLSDSGNELVGDLSRNPLITPYLR